MHTERKKLLNVKTLSMGSIEMSYHRFKKHILYCLTHPGGFVQKELIRVVCSLGGLKLSATKCHQVVFDVLIDSAVQGLEDRQRKTGTRGYTEAWMNSM